MSPQSVSNLLQTLGNGCLWIRKQASLSVHRYQEFCSGHHATIDGIHLELDRPPGRILGTLPSTLSRPVLRSGLTSTVLLWRQYDDDDWTCRLGTWEARGTMRIVNWRDGSTRSWEVSSTSKRNCQLETRKKTKGTKGRSKVEVPSNG